MNEGLNALPLRVSLLLRWLTHGIVDLRPQMASETALPPGSAPEPKTSVGHGSELNGGGPQSGFWVCLTI